MKEKVLSMDSPICSAVASEPLRLTKYLSVVRFVPQHFTHGRMRSLSPSRFTEMNLGSKSGSICGPFTWRSYIRYVCLCQHAPFETPSVPRRYHCRSRCPGTQPPASWRSHCRASPSPSSYSPVSAVAAGTEALLDAIDRYLCPACPTPAADCPSISHSGRPFCMPLSGRMTAIWIAGRTKALLRYGKTG